MTSTGPPFAGLATFASLREGTGCPMQSPGLFGVGFPSPGPRVWTFTSFQSAMPGAPACSAYIEYASARLPSLGPRSDLLATTVPVGSWGGVVGMGMRSLRSRMIGVRGASARVERDRADLPEPLGDARTRNERLPLTRVEPESLTRLAPLRREHTKVKWRGEHAKRSVARHGRRLG